MKITKAEGYEKPKYAVAVAAALVAASLTGCGGVDYAGGISMGTPPEEEEIQLAGDVSVEQINSTIDYDGGIEMYTEPEDEVQLAGETVEMIDDSTDDGEDEEENNPEAYVEPLDDELVLEGGVSICEPGNEPPMLEGSIEISEP